MPRGPSARIGEEPATNTGRRPRLGVAGNYTQGPKPGLARDHPPPQTADPSQEWRGTARRTLSQDGPGTTNKPGQQTLPRNGRELHLRPSARIGGSPPTTHTRQTHKNTNTEGTTLRRLKLQGQKQQKR